MEVHQKTGAHQSPCKQVYNVHCSTRLASIIHSLTTMAGIFRSFLHATNYRSPLLRTVVPTVAAAFAIQGAVAIPSILAQTERFYDLSGSLTYLSCAALSLYLPVLRARAATGAGTFGLPWPSILKSLQGKSLAQGGFWDWRQLVLTAFVGIWATRCVSKYLQE